MEAEQSLREIAGKTGMQVTMFFSLLVSGPGVKANFAAMMRWLQRSVYLLLGGIHNQRILVVLDHLVDLIVKCITHPAAASQIFLVSDGEDVSITELMRRMCKALVALARFIPGAGELAESVGVHGGQAGCGAAAVWVFADRYKKTGAFWAGPTRCH